MSPVPTPSPDRLSPTQRAHEITTILAAAILRSALTESGKKTEFDLGLWPGKSVHTTPYPTERV